MAGAARIACRPRRAAPTTLLRRASATRLTLPPRYMASVGTGSQLIAVQPALRDVLNDAVGHQIPDWMSAADSCSAFGRGDRKGRDLQQLDPVRGQVRQREVVPGPSAADELGEREQLVRISPGNHPGQRVGAGDEEELRFWAALGTQVAQGVNGEGLPRPVDVDAADGEPRIG